MNACFYRSWPFFILFAALVVGGFPKISKAEILVGAGSERSEIRQIGPRGMPTPTEIFDVDTNTGVRTQIQQFTQRGPAFLTAMDRDSSGTLWGIHEPNRLVTIDEETGLVTDVVALTNPDAYIRGIPAIAFVPGTEEILYAIVRFEGNDINIRSKSDIVDGFLLAEVDTETGVVTPVYPVPGGRYGNGLAHGLEYDATYGLVHMWAENNIRALSAKTGDVGIAVEILDPVSQTSEPVPYDGPPPYMAEFVVKTDSGIIPRGFQATAHSGRPGVIYVYQPGEFLLGVSRAKVPFGPFLLGIEILDNEGGLSYTTCFEGDVFMNAMSMSMYLGSFESRAMELTGDGAGILLEINSALNAFAPDLLSEPLTAESKGSAGIFWSPTGSVNSSIGGYVPEFGSLATDPVSGLVYALAYDGLRRPKSKAKEFSGGPSVGLNVIDRDGPDFQELDGFDIPLTDPNIVMMAATAKKIGPILFSPLTDVEAIAFDDAGVLFGIANERHLVVIDLPSGEVYEVEGFNGNLTYEGYGYQLEFNPADGKLYILFYAYSYEDRPSGWTLVSVNRDGSNPVSTLVEGPLLGEGPTALVTTGPDSFIFTASVSVDNPTLKDPGDYSFGFFGLGSDGVSSPPLPGVVTDFYISALTQVPFIPTAVEALPDILIGEKRDRLNGNNIYSPNAGPSQTISIRDTSKQLKGDFFAEVQNDGETGALFTIAARGGKSSDDIKYLSDLGNITADLKRGFSVPLGPGARIRIQAKFSRDDDRKLKEKFRIQVLAGSRVDAGIAKVKIKQPRDKKLAKPKNLF